MSVTREQILVETIFRTVNDKAAMKIIDDLNERGSTIQNVYRQAGRVVVESSDRMGAGLELVTRSSYGLKGSLKDVAVETRAVRQEFDMSMLTWMFAGMIVQRTGESIARSTVSTFMKISEGASEAGRNLTQLSAEFTYLKFEIGRAIGEALGPLLPVLIPIIRAMADFAQKNPGVVFSTVFGAIALGMAAFTVANVKMVLDVLKGMDSFSGENLSKTLDKFGKGVAIGFGLVEAVDAFQDVNAGDYWSALGSALTSGGMFMLASDNKKTMKNGSVLVLAGVGLQMASEIDGDVSQIGQALQDHAAAIAVAAGMRWGLKAGVFTFIIAWSIEPLTDVLKRGYAAARANLPQDELGRTSRPVIPGPAFFPALNVDRPQMIGAGGAGGGEVNITTIQNQTIAVQQVADATDIGTLMKEKQKSGSTSRRKRGITAADRARDYMSGRIVPNAGGGYTRTGGVRLN